MPSSSVARSLRRPNDELPIWIETRRSTWRFKGFWDDDRDEHVPCNSEQIRLPSRCRRSCIDAQRGQMRNSSRLKAAVFQFRCTRLQSAGGARMRLRRRHGFVFLKEKWARSPEAPPRRRTSKWLCCASTLMLAGRTTTEAIRSS